VNAQNPSALRIQLRTFATVGLSDAANCELSPSISLGMTLATWRGLERRVFMTVERYLRLIAGCFVLATLLLGYFHSPYWFLFTGFVAINLIQSAFTNWCPMMSFLRWLGAKSDAPVSRGSAA
jgi:hypothetical protein